MAASGKTNNKRGINAVYASFAIDLEQFLSDHLKIEVRTAHLPELQSFLVATPHEKHHHGLVVSDQSTGPERIYLYIHTAAHLLLGHLDRPCAMIIEPNKSDPDALLNFSVEERAREREAEDLTHKLLLGYADEDLTYSCADCICDPQFVDHCQRIRRILPGHDYDRTRHIMRLGFPRRTIVAGLRLLRRLHNEFGNLANERGFMRNLREVYCLAEVTEVSPIHDGLHEHSVLDDRSSPDPVEFDAA